MCRLLFLPILRSNIRGAKHRMNNAVLLTVLQSGVVIINRNEHGIFSTRATDGRIEYGPWAVGNFTVAGRIGNSTLGRLRLLFGRRGDWYKAPEWFVLPMPLIWRLKLSKFDYSMLNSKGMTFELITFHRFILYQGNLMLYSIISCHKAIYSIYASTFISDERSSSVGLA